MESISTTCIIAFERSTILFIIIRFFIFIALSSFTVIKLLKSKIIHKRLLSVLSTVLCITIITASAMFPVENLFVSFQSPESVFRYSEFGKIENVIYGESSCMILYTSGNAGRHSILLKTEKGYQIPGYFTSKKISNRFDENGYFDVYTVPGTRDYYIVASVAQKAEESDIAVLDQSGKDVKCSILKGKGTDFLFIYVHDLPDECYLSVGGERVIMIR